MSQRSTSHPYRLDEYERSFLDASSQQHTTSLSSSSYIGMGKQQHDTNHIIQGLIKEGDEDGVEDDRISPRSRHPHPEAPSPHEPIELEIITHRIPNHNDDHTSHHDDDDDGLPSLLKSNIPQIFASSQGALCSVGGRDEAVPVAYPMARDPHDITPKFLIINNNDNGNNNGDDDDDDRHVHYDAACNAAYYDKWVEELQTDLHHLNSINNSDIIRQPSLGHHHPHNPSLHHHHSSLSSSHHHSSNSSSSHHHHPSSSSNDTKTLRTSGGGGGGGGGGGAFSLRKIIRRGTGWDKRREREGGRLSPLSEKLAIIHTTLEVPSSSTVARAIAGLIIATTLLFCVAFMTSTVASLNSSTWLLPIDAVCIAIFTLEYILRLLSAPVWYRWVATPLHLIDLLAIVPFYIAIALYGTDDYGSEKVVTGLPVLKVVRLLKVFRVLKFGRYSRTMRLVPKVLRRSKAAILLLSSHLFLCTIIFSSCVYFAEISAATWDESTSTWMDHNGEPSHFQSVFHGFWWCIVTITTVGYGDTYPVTIPGKLVAALCMLVGVMVIAFPVSIIGKHAHDVWREYAPAEDRQQHHHHQHHHHHHHGHDKDKDKEKGEDKDKHNHHSHHHSSSRQTSDDEKEKDKHKPIPDVDTSAADKEKISSSNGIDEGHDKHHPHHHHSSRHALEHSSNSLHHRSSHHKDHHHSSHHPKSDHHLHPHHYSHHHHSSSREHSTSVSLSGSRNNLHRDALGISRETTPPLPPHPYYDDHYHHHPPPPHGGWRNSIGLNLTQSIGGGGGVGGGVAAPFPSTLSSSSRLASAGPSSRDGSAPVSRVASVHVQLNALGEEEAADASSYQLFNERDDTRRQILIAFLKQEYKQSEDSVRSVQRARVEIEVEMQACIARRERLRRALTALLNEEGDNVHQQQQDGRDHHHQNSRRNVVGDDNDDDDDDDAIPSQHLGSSSSYNPVKPPSSLTSTSTPGLVRPHFIPHQRRGSVPTTSTTTNSTLGTATTAASSSPSLSPSSLSPPFKPAYGGAGGSVDHRSGHIIDDHHSVPAGRFLSTISDAEGSKIPTILISSHLQDIIEEKKLT
eukprot:TRINITY_DN10733_c0_g1_i12.p1 TRINITY_DN10733_c0_g1~~TRINITY_DN10733_c0_g1_i12.p1  ORF type:complete len:1076 (+),score=254.78 TRINITY_DN10733_c0_g1_i12:266-3493(+)